MCRAPATPRVEPSKHPGAAGTGTRQRWRKEPTMAKQISLDTATQDTTGRFVVRQSIPPLRVGLHTLAALAATAALALALAVGIGSDRAQTLPASAPASV